MQDCSNSIANALELLQSCTKPSIPCTVCGHRADINAWSLSSLVQAMACHLIQPKWIFVSPFICNLWERSRGLPKRGQCWCDSIWCEIPVVIIYWWCGYFCRIFRKTPRKDRQIVHELCGMNVTINSEKSQILVFKRGFTNVRDDLYYGDSRFKVTNKMSYLGLVFSSNGFFKNSQAIL